jgi:hypothetical protein
MQPIIFHLHRVLWREDGGCRENNKLSAKNAEKMNHANADERNANKKCRTTPFAH